MQFEIDVKTNSVRFKPHAVKGIALLAIVDSFHKLGGEMIDTVSDWTFPKHITSEVLSEVIHNTCFVCGGLMKDEIAIQNGVVKVYGEDVRNIHYTSYVDPTNHSIIKVRKCSMCGHSHT